MFPYPLTKANPSSLDLFRF